jgi:hypothetical protein
VEQTKTGWALGLEIPIYLLKLNALDFFVAPGFGYTPVTTTTKTTTPAALGRRRDFLLQLTLPHPRPLSTTWRGVLSQPIYIMLPLSISWRGGWGGEDSHHITRFQMPRGIADW